MKKKILILALVLALFAVFSASAYQAAIGAEFVPQLIGSTLPDNFFLTFRLPKFPPVLAIGGSEGGVAIMADWWLAQGGLVGFINYYVGPGCYMQFGQDSANVGIRVPVGLDAYPIKPLELFLEIAPSITLITTEGFNLGWGGFQTGVGFRFWF
jgi:hypothetical protein